MRFDLVDLRLFIAVVEAGSISRGADVAHMALASASARIGGMEALLGASLLDRGRRGVVPTPAGRTLLRHARIVTAQIERMRGDLSAFASGLKGHVRMLSNTASLVDLLPAAVRVFLTAHPDVDVEIEERTSADIVAAVAEGRAEFGLIADSADPGDLQTIAVADDRLVLLVPAGHVLAGDRSVAFVDLLDEPFVGLSAGALHSHLADQAARLGRRIGYRVRLRSFETVARLVEAGIGIGILPFSAAERFRSGALAIVPLADPWAHRRLTICARRFEDLSRHARALVDEIVRQGAELPQAAP
ncbi:LysR family transcriptional regulator [Novosphingobium sp. BL-52-GroH]|uniref:LysR family transcriptional regulator n=1 Tax=Novosphingobium sp. BL-52-GroH TaxID=3349877 RepID=UPI0038516FD5